MRVRDELKQDALFKATIKLINEIGFASSSMAKIAREAGISQATVYIYHKNKEDLMVSTYMDIKRAYCQAMLNDFDENRPIVDVLKKAWLNLFAYITEHQAEFYFTEQFASSPYTDLIDENEIERLLAPFIQIIQKGIAQKIIKNVDFDILVTFIFYPILNLANPKRCAQFDGNKKSIETAFQLAWDAIKR